MYKEKITWPNEKKCAVMVTINLSAELFWLQLDPTCIDKPKTLSMGQYGMTNGLQRVLDVLENRKIKATFFVPGKVAELYEDDIRLIISKGHEIASSGYSYNNLALLTKEEQEEDIKKGINVLNNICGEKPVGFRAPVGELTLDTLRIANENGMKYSSDLSDDDRPYMKKINDDNSILQIPISWALYDLPYFAFNYHPAFPKGQGRLSNYSGVLSNWKDEFDGHYEYGLCYVLQLEPQAIGNPGRIGLLENLLDYIMEKDDIWYATGKDVLEFFEGRK